MTLPCLLVQQLKEVQSAAAINGVLSGLPLPAGADPVHVSNMLRMLGSVQLLAQAHPQQIAAHTGLDIARCARSAVTCLLPAGLV